MNIADRQRLASLYFPKRTSTAGGSGSATGSGLRLVKAASDSVNGSVDVIIGAPEYDEFGNEIVSTADVTVTVPIVCAAHSGDDVMIAIIDGNPVAIGVPGMGSDYPVFRGIDGIWEYTIYASGEVDMWGKTSSITVTSWTQWSGTIIRYSSLVGGDAYPTDLFDTAPYVLAEWTSTTNDAWSSKTGGSASAAPQLYLYRPLATTSATGYITYHVKGTVGASFPWSGGGGVIPDGDDLGYGS